MDTRSIIMREVINDLYQMILYYWESNLKMHRDDVAYTMIENPIALDIDPDDRIGSYKSALEFMLELPFADVLCFYDGEEWQKPFASNIDYSYLGTIAKTAANGERKRNFLEIKLQKGFGPDKPKAIIEFMEYECKLIGWQVQIDVAFMDTFDIKIANLDGIKYIKGMWPGNFFD